jgi:phosphoadenosine phosphosulfate reductase
MGKEMVSDVPERHVEEVAAALAPLSLAQRMAAARRLVHGRLVFTTSFGLEDQAIADAILGQGLAIEVLTLDTGRLFPETYDLWSATEARYGRRIAGFAPGGPALEGLVAADGVNGFRGSVEARKRCCGVRKVAPLARALAGAAGWITGLRGGQSANRADTPIAALDATYGVLKINPLADWTRAALVAHVAEHRIAYNPLHDRGFASIGCAPCTRAIAPGEPERAGRWWWEDDGKKECGLHNRPAASATQEQRPLPS